MLNILKRRDSKIDDNINQVRTNTRIEQIQKESNTEKPVTKIGSVAHLIHAANQAVIVAKQLETNNLETSKEALEVPIKATIHIEQNEATQTIEQELKKVEVQSSIQHDIPPQTNRQLPDKLNKFTPINSYSYLELADNNIDISEAQSTRFINGLHDSITNRNTHNTLEFDRLMFHFISDRHNQEEFKHSFVDRAKDFLSSNFKDIYNSKSKIITIDLPQLPKGVSLFGPHSNGNFVLAGNLKSMEDKDWDNMYSNLIKNNT
jgi:hypothetical protein